MERHQDLNILQELENIGIIKFMKAKLTFDLGDPDDRQAHMRAIKAHDLAAVLWELVHNTHKKAEMAAEQDPDMSPFRMIDEIYAELHNMLEAHSINVDDLII